MEQNKIIEGNLLIAQFMGWSESTFYVVDGSTFKGWNLPERDFDEFLMDNQFQYHSSWNWLMNVLEKIRKSKFVYTIEIEYCSLNKPCITISSSLKAYHFQFYEEDEDIIIAIWKVVVEYINWYNGNK